MMMIVCSMFLFVILTAVRMSDGKLPAFGHHNKPASSSLVTLDIMPDPATFYDKYVSPGVPVLLRSAAKGIPAYTLWTDEYLGLVTVERE